MVGLGGHAGKAGGPGEAAALAEGDCVADPRREAPEAHPVVEDVDAANDRLAGEGAVPGPGGRDAALGMGAGGADTLMFSQRMSSPLACAAHVP